MLFNLQFTEEQLPAVANKADCHRRTGTACRASADKFILVLLQCMAETLYCLIHRAI